MSIFGSSPRSGPVVALSTFHEAFSGGLTLGGTTIGGNTDPGGSTMFLGGCWIILLGSILMSFFFSVLIGILTILDVVFCANGWAFTTVGAFPWAFA